MTAVMSSAGPGRLEDVRAFVNTVDLESGADELATPAALVRWLDAHGVVPAEAGASARDLADAVAVREALRSLLVANGGSTLDPGAPAVLDAAARRTGVALRFEADGSAVLEPDATGVGAGIGRLLAVVAGAMADGTWFRLRACDAVGCRWVFYDASRNRSRRWCSMAVCGNRTKARLYRARRGAA